MVGGHECSLRRLRGAWEELGVEAGKWEWERREVTEGKEEEEKRGEAQKLVAHGS